MPRYSICSLMQAHRSLIVAWLVALSWLAAAAEHYRMAGTVKHAHFNYEGPISESLYTFDLTVDGMRYFLHVSFTDPNIARVNYIEWCYNGSLCLEFQNREGMSRGLPPPNGAYFESIGTVQSGPIPEPELLCQPAFIWLALASGPSINQDTPAVKLRPIWFMEYRGLWDTGIQLSALVALAAQAPHLPSKAVYFNDGKARFRNELGDPVEQPAPPPYTQGFTNYVLQSEFCQTNDLMLPTTVTGIFYTINPKNPGTNTLFINSVTTLVVTNYFKPDLPLPERPTLTQRALIADHRLSGMHPSFPAQNTTTTNGEWRFLPMSELKDRANYFLAHRKKPSQSRILTVALCCMLGASFAFFAWQQRLSHKSQK